MSEEIQVNCQACVHLAKLTPWQCVSASAETMPRFGPHNCEYHEPSDAHRIASALEGIETALMVSAGLWSPDEDNGPEPMACICGVMMPSGIVADYECPNCHAVHKLVDTPPTDL